MTPLFEETTVNGLKLCNRMVRSATWEGMFSADGRPTARLMACYRDLALGGIYGVVAKKEQEKPPQEEP